MKSKYKPGNLIPGTVMLAAIGAAHRTGRGPGTMAPLVQGARLDLQDALERLSRRPSLRDPLYGTWLTLQTAATMLRNLPEEKALVK